MSSPFAKLNLRPQERRLVVFVGIVLFVVLNIWLVWPHFGDWGMLQLRYTRAQKTLDTYRTEIARVPSYKVRLAELESAGSSVVPDEQELDLLRIVDTQARLNRLTVMGQDSHPRVSQNTQTNRFFEEQYENLRVSTGNEELINFLVSLTSTNSLIRVKDMTLKRDTSGTRLDGTLTLVASYQRSAPAKGTTTRPATSTAAATAIPPAPSPQPVRTVTRTNQPPKTALASNLTNRATTMRLRQTNSPARKP